MKLFAQENYANEIADTMEIVDNDLLLAKENKFDNIRTVAVNKLIEVADDFESLGMKKQANIVRYYIEILASHKPTDEESDDENDAEDDEYWEDE